MRLLVAIYFVTFFSMPAFSEQLADKDCFVVLNQAQWHPFPGDWTFTITVQSELAGDSMVYLALNDHNRGWQHLPARNDHQSDHHEHFVVNYPRQGGGHPSMYLEVIALVTTGEKVLFDHNWHEGIFGSLLLDRSNNWSARSLSPHCQ